MTLSKSPDPIPQRWHMDFSCMVYVDGLLLINDYNVTIGFYTINENPVLNDLALDQIEMFFNVLMDGCVMITKDDYDDGSAVPLMNNIFMVPKRANDQTIGCLLSQKLMQVAGDNLDVDHISINSTLGKNIEHTLHLESPEMSVLVPSKQEWWEEKEIASEPWWLRSDTATYDKVLEEDQIFTGEFEWGEVFKEELEKADELNSGKNRFKIIDGGKNVH